VEFESGSQLREIQASAFDNCPIRSICLPSSLLEFHSQSFESCPLSSLTFEFPSHLGAIALDLGKDFCGTEIEIPDAVCAVEFRTDTLSPRLVVVRFGGESRLCSFKCRRYQGVPGTRGVFLRFSERTLKYFRELLSDRECGCSLK
jgi:hypothetical protein